MYLAELLIRKRFLDHEISEMTNFLLRALKDDSIDQDGLSTIMKSIDKRVEDRQTYLMKICRANDQVKIPIGKSTVSLSDAVKIRTTFCSKMNIVTDLIETSKGNVDVMSFIEQRRRIYEDYIVLNSAISVADWSTNID